MKKLIFISILSLFIMSSCTDTHDGTANPKTNENFPLSVTEYTYEGCQYVVFDVGKCSWGGHKGNCSNPIHKTQKSE